MANTLSFLKKDQVCLQIKYAELYSVQEIELEIAVEMSGERKLMGKRQWRQRDVNQDQY